MRILVTQGAYKHTLALIRSLAGQGHQVGVVCNTRIDLCFWSRFAQRRHLISQSKGKESYVEGLRMAAELHDYELLFPVGHPVTGWVSELRHVFPKSLRIELAAFEKIAFFEDKQKTQTLAMSLGIPVPRTIYPESLETVKTSASILQFPVVIKQVCEGAEGKVVKAKSADELEPYYQSYLEKNGTGNGKLPMIQEHLTGEGVGFFALYQKGKCLQYFMHRRIREFPVSGGISTCAESIDDPELLFFGKKILDAANWHGLAMVEFKRNEAGVPHLLEVNPKLWGSFELSMASGVDFAEKTVEMTSRNIEHEPYQKGVLFSWLFNGDLTNGLLTGRLFSIIRQIMEKSVFTNLHWDDPLATLNLIARGLLRLPLELFSR